MKVSEHEAAFLREHYATKGSTWCAEQLGLTWRQVQRRTSTLGLRQKRPWTTRDDDQLRYLWGSQTIGEISKRLNRTPATLYERAKKLKLGLGRPQGYVYLTQLATEAGFDVRATRRILVWAGVRLRRGLVRPGCPKRGRGLREYVTWIVEHTEGLEAIDQWLAAEFVDPAAQARGLTGETLKRWLLAAGHQPPKEPRQRWRVPTTIIDQVVADRLPRIGRWGAQEAA